VDLDVLAPAVPVLLYLGRAFLHEVPEDQS
jgi:hypothetical protein